MTNVAQTVITTDMKTYLSDAIELVLIENKSVLEKINYFTIAQLGQTIMNSPRIFVAGEGRSGLVIKMFAMRLMHLGHQVYVVGETITPSIQAGDLLINFSGSGTTEHIWQITHKSKEIGAYVASVTTQADSPLAKIADFLVLIEAAAKQDHSHQKSQQFSGSLFEQASLLLFDTLFHVLFKEYGKNAESLWSLHANLE
ncbi:6-phospho-3-hexuloisomerase [Nodularia sp. NIES-3585]|uniref:6-phospho-3-hexuloisomerase n=1 Tax=Nodularia sp. NIES-3585 TaxID=1973477 RepID=UPI000B5D006D|nr:6-phospho-3-hexuloisomerase [Nodularia sp. NIES-3585]GAX38306.1 3-hexulose-6-phosphate isomerase [Nodularia sp. NIES-3585]